MLKFYTTYVKQDIVLGGYMQGIFFHVSNLFKKILICTHLSHIKLFFFPTFNFETLYLFKVFFKVFYQERQIFENLCIEEDNIIKNII